MSNFLFHKVSEKEKQENKKQAKNLIEDFSKKLSKIDKKITEPTIERKQGERIEKSPKKEDSEFRKIMFENAPNKNENFILAEKKKW